MNSVDPKITEFIRQSDLTGCNILPLKGDASDRRYYRLRQGQRSVILMDSSDAKESMRSFLTVSEYLADKNFSVPQVFHFDLDNGYMILEDLGEYTVDEYLPENSHDLEKIYSSAVDLAITLSALTQPPVPEFDKQFFLHELSFFTSWYMPYIGKPMGDEETAEFNACWDKPFTYLSVHDRNRVFVHKDLHCGNLFWLPQRSGVRNLGVIDFQNAKNGSSVYDITSLLFDCRLPLPPRLRKNLLEKFLSANGLDRQTFTNVCDIFIAQRNIKILGNFAYIFLQKGNASYLQFVPNVWNFVISSLNNPVLEDVKALFVKNIID